MVCVRTGDGRRSASVSTLFAPFHAIHADTAGPLSRAVEDVLRAHPLPSGYFEQLEAFQARVLETSGARVGKSALVPVVAYWLKHGATTREEVSGTGVLYDPITREAMSGSGLV